MTNARTANSDKSARDKEQAAGKVDGRIVRGLRRREAIIEAARELFTTKGYRKTTLSDIIKEAGGSRETLYSHFQGKLGLFGAIISDWGDHFAGFVLEPKSKATPPREFLTELGTSLMEIWLSPQGREIHRTVLSEGVSSPEIMALWYRGGSEKVLNALSQYVDFQVQAGRLEVRDSMLFARQFQFLLYGEVASPVIAGDSTPIDVTAAVERTVDLMMRATAAEKSGPDRPA